MDAGVQVQHLMPAARKVAFACVEQDRALRRSQRTQEVCRIVFAGSGHLWVIWVIGSSNFSRWTPLCAGIGQIPYPTYILFLLSIDKRMTHMTHIGAKSLIYKAISLGHLAKNRDLSMTQRDPELGKTPRK